MGRTSGLRMGGRIGVRTSCWWRLFAICKLAVDSLDQFATDCSGHCLDTAFPEAPDTDTAAQSQVESGGLARNRSLPGWYDQLCSWHNMGRQSVFLEILEDLAAAHIWNNSSHSLCCM